MMNSRNGKIKISPSTKTTTGFIPGRSVMFGIVLIVFLIIATRLINIDADPPYWVGEAFIGDGGWWAGSAKGKVLLDDYFSVDFGMSYLLLPFYTWTLESIFNIWGVGIVQTRYLAAFSNIITILLIAVLVWKRTGLKNSLITTAMLGISPFYWAYSRVELPESMQSLFIVAAIFFWLYSEKSNTTAFFSGIAIAISIAVKPSAVRVGLLPIAIAIITPFLIELSKGYISNDAEKLLCMRSRILLCISGIIIGCGFIFIFHVIPNWNEFWAILSPEAGISGFDWRKLLTLPSMSLVSTLFKEVDYRPVVWRLLWWSPLIIFGTWMYFLWFFLGIRSGIKGFVGNISSFEITIFIWVLATLFSIFTCINQPDYRFAPIIPGLSILSCLILSRMPLVFKDPSKLLIRKRFQRFYSFCIWGILLFPLVVITKPYIANVIMSSVMQNLQLGQKPGIGVKSSLTIAVVLWLLALLFLSKYRDNPIKISQISLKIGRPIFVALFIYEFSIIGLCYTDMQSTYINAQKELKGFVTQGSTVFGKWGGTLFMPYKVRAFQRLHSNELEHPVNSEEMLRELHPGYIVVPTIRNFTNNISSKFAIVDLESKGYTPIFSGSIGPKKNGIYRFKIEILKFNE